MNNKKKVVIIGPAHPLRGGIATFNHRLAKEFLSLGHDCSIYSFSLQYPSFLFPGKTQFSTDSAPENIIIHTKINSINPFNWLKIGNEIKRLKPDIVVVRYWLPFMGPALGTILRRIKKNHHTNIVCIADNIVPHEKRVGDQLFTRYFLKSCDAFITMSNKVMQDLRSFEKEKKALLIPHPLYDNFGAILSKGEARKQIGLPPGDKIILFFGFIRKYKGLDLLLQAMHLLKKETAITAGPGAVKLLVAGEFYEDEKPYQELIEKLDIGDRLIMQTAFIPDSEVKYYLCAADLVVQPYRNATQSGVTPLAYHFEKPMVVTNVGGLPDLVPHKKVGLVVDPNPQSIAEGIATFYEMGEEHFIPHIKSEKLKYGWPHIVNAVLNLG